MLESMGMVLVGAGCACIGFRAAGRLRVRIRALEQMLVGLRLLAQELELEGDRLAQAMAVLDNRVAGSAKEIFVGCRKGLERLEEEPFPLLWRRLVKEQADLGAEGQSCLIPLGESLGRCDCAAQCRAVEGVCLRLEQLLERERERSSRQGNLYRVMGVAGGAMLVILLL